MATCGVLGVPESSRFTNLPEKLAEHLKSCKLTAADYREHIAARCEGRIEWVIAREKHTGGTQTIAAAEKVVSGK